MTTMTVKDLLAHCQEVCDRLAKNIGERKNVSYRDSMSELHEAETSFAELVLSLDITDDAALKLCDEYCHTVCLAVESSAMLCVETIEKLCDEHGCVLAERSM